MAKKTLKLKTRGKLNKPAAKILNRILDGIPKPPKPEVPEEIGEVLTERQRSFIHHYLICRNGAKAARLAGYAIESANVEGSRLLANANISKIVSDHAKETEKKFLITHDAIIQELAAIAFFNIKDVMRLDGSGVSLKDWGELEDWQTKAIASVTETSSNLGGSMGFKAWDKIRALELIGKQTGMKFGRDKDDAGSESDKDARKNALERVRGIVSKHRK